MKENWIWLLFEIMINFHQGFLVTYFLEHVLNKKQVGKWPMRIFRSVFGICCSTYIFFDMPAVDTWIFLIALLYILLFFKNSLGVKLLWWAILTVLFNGISMICISIRFTPLYSQSDLQIGTMHRIVLVLSINVVLTLVFYIIANLKCKTYIKFSSLIVFAIINLLVECITNMFFSLHSHMLIDNLILFLSSIIALAISFCSVILFSMISEYAEQEYTAKKTEDWSNIERQRAEDLNAAYISLHNMRHDLKNHLSIVRTLIDSGHKIEGVKYLEEIDSQIFSVFSSGCVALDSALTFKEAQMRQKNITFHCELCSLCESPISDYEMCSIITNLLDNAIEAIERADLPNKSFEIELFIRRVRNMLYIECKNPADQKTINKRENVFYTSKPDSNHGIGIKNIEAIVSKAHGITSFTYDNQMFIAFISLPYNIT